MKQITQDPVIHAQWDLRFSEIHYLCRAEEPACQRFRYLTRIGFGRTVAGWGETALRDGGRRSVLRFGSEDPLSLIRQGAGFWAYGEDHAGCTLATVYDYRTRGGRWVQWLDRLAFRPLMVWATRWSFDRLRLWLETGAQPRALLRLWLVKVGCRWALGLVWCLEGLVPKILAVRPSELAVVEHSGWVIGSPQATLNGLGAAELLFGLWLLGGLCERTSVLVSTLAILALVSLVGMVEPSALADPFGGITKNLGLVACGGVVWMLAPMAPKARRARA